jgi:hypothetical protein
MEHRNGIGELVGARVPGAFFVIKVAARWRVDAFRVLFSRDPSLDLVVGVVNRGNGVDN